MPSDVDCCNRALRRLGQPPITALDGSTPTGALCLDLYAQTRDGVLIALKPRCAQHRVNLAVDADYDALTNKVGYLHRYPVPADYLTLLGLGGEETPSDDPYTEEGGAILTDHEAPLPIRYIRRIPEGAMTADVFDLVATTLVAELAYPVTHSHTLTATLQQEAATKLALVRHDQALRGTPPERRDASALTRVRSG